MYEITGIAAENSADSIFSFVLRNWSWSGFRKNNPIIHFPYSSFVVNQMTSRLLMNLKFVEELTVSVEPWYNESQCNVILDIIRNLCGPWKNLKWGEMPCENEV